MVPDPHKPLRDDVRFLGELLGETISTQAGEALFQKVERVRVLAKGARAGSDGDFETLADELSRMPLDDALPLARAFAQFLHLANIAEQHHRIRRRREYQRDPNARPQRGSCEDGFRRLLAEGMSVERLHDAVCALRIELVLTAHPTEVARRRIAQKHNRLASALAVRDRPDLTVPEREALEASLRQRGARGLGHERSPQPTADTHRRGPERPHRLRTEPVGRPAPVRARRGPGAAGDDRPRSASACGAPALRLLDGG